MIAKLARWRVARLSRLGALRRRAGDPRGAERAYRQALAVAEHRLPADDLATARCRNHLGVVLKYAGAFAEAARLYDDAHAVFVARLGPAHPDVGMVMHNIGGLAHARGRSTEGEAAARRALCISAAALGDDHPATAADRTALAASSPTWVTTTRRLTCSSRPSRSSSVDSAPCITKSA